MEIKGKLAITYLALAMTCQVAVADAVTECHREFQPEASLRACNEIINDPNYGPDEKAFAYSFRGAASVDAGAIQSAIADFTESIQLKKDNTAAFAGRGRANFAAENFPASISDYSEAIRLSPASAELYIGRGHVYIVSGSADAAIRDLTEAIRLNPASARAYSERGVAYVNLGESDRAQADFTASIKILPLPEPFLNRALVHEAKGRTKEAIDDYRQALRRDPSLIEARVALRRLGDAEATTETDQRIRDGQALAEKNWGSCHAVGNRGISPDRNAPEFRNIYRQHRQFGLRVPITRGIKAAHAQMSQFMSSDKEIDMIIAYISSLSTGR